MHHPRTLKEETTDHHSAPLVQMKWLLKRCLLFLHETGPNIEPCRIQNLPYTSPLQENTGQILPGENVHAIAEAQWSAAITTV